ncbi:hypothetical protein INT43_003004, partial [Umbelopsis isabellina]
YLICMFVNRLLTAFHSIAICLFLAALDTTIVSTAIPRISSDFHALEQGSWIATVSVAIRPTCYRLTHCR